MDMTRELAGLAREMAMTSPTSVPIDAMTQFETGATRSADVDKLDYEGFLSPLVLQRYAEYLHEHRTQADGNLRDSDNWQQGMPRPRYVKSLIRHTFDFWKRWRNPSLNPRDETGQNKAIEDDACAIMFNIQGWLLETLKERGYA